MLHAMAKNAASECLDEETIAGLVAGALDGAARAQVEAHVARCAECRGVVDAAHGMGKTGARSRVGRKDDDDNLEVSSEIARAPSSQPWATPLPRVGDVLAGKYRVERILGQGGMGTVLAAHHVELKHRVAIKVLHSGGPAAAARFLREAQMCAQLANDHIVRGFDVGRLPGGAPYLVMEYLVGEDLSKLVGRGPLPMADAVGYVLQACAALAQAHAAGVVHRDLKPANLFLTMRTGGAPLLKVVDFGISKIIADEDSDPELALTSTGAILGSPLYMSPEQIRASRDVDARTDIWSLGVILYELLTGRPPFNAPSFSALAVAIATEPVAPPSRLRPELPQALEAIVLRCLEKDLSARIPSVVILAEKLAPFRTTLPSAPGRSTSRRGAIMAAGVATVVALGAAGAVVARRQTPAPNLEAPSIAPPAPAPPPAMSSVVPDPLAVPAAADLTVPVSPSAAAAPPAVSSAKPRQKSTGTASPQDSGAPHARPPASVPKAPKPDPTGSPD